MTIQGTLTLCLPVHDYDEAIDFHVHKLGWVVAEDALIGPDCWVTLPASPNLACLLALHQAQTESDRALVGQQAGSFPFLGMGYRRLPG